MKIKCLNKSNRCYTLFTGDKKSTFTIKPNEVVTLSEEQFGKVFEKDFLVLEKIETENETENKKNKKNKENKE